jgi:hypothetical protein
MEQIHDKARIIINRYDSIKSKRHNWENHWEEVAEVVLPRKNNIFTNKQTKGDKRNQNLYDSTAIHSNELLSSALHGMLTNPTVEWFELSTGDELLDSVDSVRFWLQDSVKRMHRVLNNSNFQTEIHEVYLDLGSFGTSVLMVEEDDENTVRFRAHPIYDVFIEENNKGVIDVVYRVVQMTIKQMVEEFGEDKLPVDLIKKLSIGKNDDYNVIHYVGPLKENNKKKGAGFNFESVYILEDRKLILSEGGFRQFPFIVSRWTKESGEVYGRSPAMKSLGDIKMLQQVMKTIIRGAQKTIDPPLLLPDDGMLLPLRTAPGAINFYRAGSSDPINPLNTGGRVDFGFEMVGEVRVRIREAFFIDQLQLAQGPQMTATEVQQRTEERLRLLAPILARQNFELLRPLVDNLFDLMVKQKLFLPAPEELAAVPGGKLDVQYSSQIAKAQRSVEGQVFNRVVEAVGPAIQADPGLMDNFDGDEIVRKTARTFGLPQTMLRSTDKMEQMRQQRAEAQEAQARAEAERQQAETANKMAAPVREVAKLAE